MSSERRFVPGQRWISVTEPELGLGAIRRVDARAVSVWFEGVGDSREYATHGDIPLRRAAFHAGDTIATGTRASAGVTAVREAGGLLYYETDGGEVCETELSARLGFGTPLRRLFAGQFDEPALFAARHSALMLQHASRQSEVRGLVGARIDLLPHQLGIAATVSNRLLPRVLLADEVGLGKTIEACLVLHRLLVTGRARRVLILVPETLVHQWFLELLRRFNLWFHIFTEARCAAIEEAAPGVNPFEDDQLILCELGLVSGDARRLEQALAAAWDLVVVDEAHHLTWTPEAASPAYAAVERLGGAAPGLLLLTATPEQLGRTGHFARLRLLDPERFHDLDAFVRESEGYRDVARLAGAIAEGTTLAPADGERLGAIVGAAEAGIAHDLASAEGRRRLLDRLLDQHGTSRVMFRNTRATIAGFPRRIAALYPLDAGRSRQGAAALADEWAGTAGLPCDAAPRLPAHDPRIEWLCALLQELDRQKVLVIGRTPQTVKAIEAALRERTSVAAVPFHEELSLLQRDRGAASFADAAGARVLIASEIGSEGRNFQFAHHLVLFDLPLDPGLLEQRLGRLDRIGQQSDIRVHVPYIRGSHQEMLARWYHEGLDAFEHHLPGAREIADRFAPVLRALAGRAGADRHAIARELPALIADTRHARDEITRRLEEGRDRLLEWNSARPALAGRTIAAIGAEDEDRALDEFLLTALDLFAIEVEEIAPRTYRLGSAGVLVDDFPGLKADGLTVTRDRARALVREDIQFLTWDHPLATGALDLVLGGDSGNCAFGHWVDAGTPVLVLDALYVLECLASPLLHVDRFLPPTPVRAVTDHRGASLDPPVAPAVERAHPGLSRALLERPQVRDRFLPLMIERTGDAAERQAAALRADAAARMRTALAGEIERLRDLQRVNPLVRPEEIAALEQQQRALAGAIAAARLRLDAVRLIYRGPRR